MSKAIIGVEGFDTVAARVRKTARRLDAKRAVRPADYHLNFGSAALLMQELSAKRMETLRMLKREGPLSIYALAKLLGRNYSNVHQDVARLLEHGLAEKDEFGRVLVPWDDVIVRIDTSVMSEAA